MVREHASPQPASCGLRFGWQVWAWALRAPSTGISFGTCGREGASDTPGYLHRDAPAEELDLRCTSWGRAWDLSCGPLAGSSCGPLSRDSLSWDRRLVFSLWAIPCRGPPWAPLVEPFLGLFM